ncbi:signal recognition particle-docking protein FtsY [Acidiferrimicrobium sp. IK]|uniref:signal recognition particle-docking protein FtsY n=1 Tax=Acidiferrimicrobium sp. IK TaxID=2871700 RepID=UPI0021CB2260|nr:signal recognition particle-docking protein FtsY [Acidiferrimicrobium sp. IK]MCU4183774.1 signal recognition particle-docking protein FtsY [Acidiferrimicrobium sp. IK]
MLTLIIVLIVVAVVLLSTATFLVTGRRRGRRLEAPPGRPPAPPVTRPTQPPRPTEAGPRAPPQPEIAEPAVAEPAVTEPAVAEPEVAEPEAAELEVLEGEPEVLERPRFRDRLGKARNLFSGYLTSVRGREKIDATTWDELEEALILADVGVDATAKMLDDLRSRVRKEGLTTPDALVDALKGDMVSLLEGDRELHLQSGVTNVWLFVGVNGVGKTTTIGKLGQRARRDGHSVVMAAGDTFRAAAADQLAMWAERVDAEVVRGNEGGDPGAVIFDAVQHAAAKKADLVLADTAGRLHTKVNLMEELKKVRRVAGREPGHVSEVLLVIDATTGQNGLVQAKQFADAVEVTGVVLTKLDGTAKGGIALAIASELGIPIKLVGLGEGAEDLVDFDAVEFVDALIDAD